jgi:hypothetical protein
MMPSTILIIEHAIRWHMADGMVSEAGKRVRDRYVVPMPERMSRQASLLSSILGQASRCPFYHGKVIADASLDDLSKLPVLHYPSVKEAVDSNSWGKVLGAKPDFIFETSGSTGDAKRIPYSKHDIDQVADDYALLMHIIGLRHDDVGWDFGGAYPLVSGEVMERTIAKIPLDSSLATLLKSDTDLVRSLKKASRLQKLDAMAGAALLFFLIARMCNDRGYLPSIVRGKLERGYHLPSPLAAIMCKLYLVGLDEENLRRLSSNVRIGISYAEPITPYTE